MAGTLSPAVRALGHTPEARKKAVATRLRRLAEKKAAEAEKEKEAGTTTMFNVADLNLPRKQSKPKKGGRRTFTPAEKLAYVTRIETALKRDRDTDLKDVLAAEGIHGSQLYSWQRQRKKLAKLASGKKLNGHKSLNGTVHPGAIGERGQLVRFFYDIDTHTSEIVVTVKGNHYALTIDEALQLREGLTSMGF